MCQINSSVAFNGKPMESEEFLDRMVEILGIIIDRCPKGRLHRRENYAIEKISCAPIYIIEA